jgi:hypothetical protein
LLVLKLFVGFIVYNSFGGFVAHLDEFVLSDFLLGAFYRDLLFPELGELWFMRALRNTVRASADGSELRGLGNRVYGIMQNQVGAWITPFDSHGTGSTRWCFPFCTKLP